MGAYDDDQEKCVPLRTSPAHDYTVQFPKARGFALERTARSRADRLCGDQYSYVVQRRADGRWLAIVLLKPEDFIPVHFVHRGLCMTNVLDEGCAGSGTP